jgi:hypothetical protein
VRCNPFLFYVDFVPQDSNPRTKRPIQVEFRIIDRVTGKYMDFGAGESTLSPIELNSGTPTHCPYIPLTWKYIPEKRHSHYRELVPFIKRLFGSPLTIAIKLAQELLEQFIHDLTL